MVKMNLLNNFLKKNHIEIITLPIETKTAQDAALALNKPLSSIVKSLLFIVGNNPILFLVPGDKQANINKLKQIFKKRY